MNDETGILRDIAYALKADYDDFTESEEDEMDIELGEIYRAKLHNIFLALKREGVDFS